VYFDTGGTLKIYGETLCPEVPYKTLLLSTNDTVAHVVRETLDKYGLEKEDAHRYCLMQVTYLRLCVGTVNGILTLDSGLPTNACQQMKCWSEDLWL